MLDSHIRFGSTVLGISDFSMSDLDADRFSLIIITEPDDIKRFEGSWIAPGAFALIAR
jgi:hypothetical protein